MTNDLSNNYLLKQFRNATIKMYFYIITNMINNKKYIGQTSNTENRWKRHKHNSNNGCDGAIYNAIRKHGIENFNFSVFPIIKYGQNSANEEEKRLIKQFNSFGKNGYNMTEGGDGCSGYKWTEKQRLSISGKIPWNKGIKWEEMSGKNNPMYGIPSPNKGKKNPEHSERLKKTYKYTFDDGSELTYKGLQAFCDRFNYTLSNLIKVLGGRQSYHKNIIKIEEILNV